MVASKSKPIKKISEHHAHEHHAHHKHKLSNSIMWPAISLVLFVMLVVSIFTNGFRFDKVKAAEDSLNYLIKSEQKTETKVMLSDALSSVQKAKALMAVSKPAGNYNGKTAKLEFYVMSKCPYGTQVEDAVKPVLDKLGSAVDFSIDYIASENSGSFSSLHGETEVSGDIVDLCAAKYNPDKYMSMIVCMNQDASNIPANWEQCAKNNNLDVEKIRACYDGVEGKTLLSDSVKKSTAANAQGSPTMYLNGQPYQSGRDELSFMRAICGQLDSHPACAEIPACAADADCTASADKVGKCTNPNTKEAKCDYIDPPVVNLIEINDKRCPECQQADALVSQLQAIFKGLETTKYDYSDAEGKKLVDDLKIKYLPAFLFDESVKEGEGYARVQRYLAPAGSYLSLNIGASFDPKAEICDNKLDDNGNGLIDCADSDCKENLVCRSEVPKKVDLFVMSQCPYGVQAMNAMKEVLTNFKGNMNFELHFIASDNGDGTFSSLHGQGEVDEDIRESCAIKYYPTDNQFMDYIWCRNQNLQDANWQSCAEQNKMDANKIKTCSEGDEGKALLRQRISVANALQIGSSPTWMTNNKYMFSGIDAETVRQNFCQYNNVTGCDKTLTGTTPQQAASGAACG